jgi:hypothetical protein
MRIAIVGATGMLGHHTALAAYPIYTASPASQSDDWRLCPQ